MGWKKADCLVLSWLLNSISKDILESFIFANSSRDLWLEIEARFGDCNGPMIYQTHREINNTLQGIMSVTQYYSKFKRLCDELSCLDQYQTVRSNRKNKIKEFTNLIINTNNNTSPLIRKTWKENPKHLTFDSQHMEEQ